jgi:molybdate transport system substrate-binding protein
MLVPGLWFVVCGSPTQFTETRKVIGTVVVALAGLALAAPAAQAAVITVLSAGAIEPGLAGLADTFRRNTGTEVAITFGTAPALRRIVAAGQEGDILIAPPAAIEDFVKTGKVAAEERAVIGRVGVGVAVRSDARVPDIATTEALKRAVLAADSLVYNEASTGIYFARLLERLGIANDVKAKTTRYPDGAAVLDHLLKGKGNEIGVGAITEIIVYTKKGLKLVGPLPSEVQNYTTYTAALMAGAKSPDAAKAFIRFLTSPSSKAAFAATGVE